MDEETRNKLKSPNFILGVVFLLLVLIGLSVSAIKVNDWLENKQKVPLKNVVLNGQLSHVTQHEVETTLRTGQPVSFFLLDVDKAHEDLEQLPWVYQASIRKKWPDTLVVYVIEQQAVAQWNGDSLLNQNGGVFYAPLGEKEVSLPKLYGPGGSELTALQGFKAMQGLLSSSRVGIAELFLSERYAWNIKLDNGISVNLGRKEFMDRLQRFIDVYPLLQKEKKQIQYVDLRYDTGVAVGWQD